MGKTMAVQQQLVKADVIANLFSVSVRRIQQLTQDGVISTVKDPKGGARRYDLMPTIKTYIEFLANKAYGRTSSEKEAELKNQKLEVELQLKKSQSELHQLKTGIARGEYLAIEDVKSDYQKFFAIFKKFALAIPNRITGHLTGEIKPAQQRAIEKDMNKEIRAMLKTFIVAGQQADVGVDAEK